MTTTLMTSLTSLLLKPPPHSPPPSQAGGAAVAAAGIMMMLFVGLIATAFAVVWLASMWRIFTKAGQPGWMAIVPILNVITLLNIINKPVWWIVLCFIPLANLFVAIMMPVELAKVFGQGTGFAVGLILLPIVFYPMLAFGSATYQGASPMQAGGAPAYY